MAVDLPRPTCHHSGYKRRTLPIFISLKNRQLKTHKLLPEIDKNRVPVRPT